MKSETRRYAQGARAQSTEETGQRIVGAFLERLRHHWYDEITLARVAEDAGVTVQTIIRRFGDKDGLLALAVKAAAAEFLAARAPVRDLVGAVLADYEQNGDMVIRLLALEPRHPGLQTWLEFGRQEHRRWVASRYPEADVRTLDALVVTTDVYTWKLLRRDLGRSLEETAAIMHKLLEGARS